ncbi:hypothetical protein BESB_037600 [Besnoitia besnoiti]|uniref:tRNA-intron lyase n=1 Tax=Besnoitia besnoiti TaxID=94643 RepID=A0A2A9MNM9_BESBE|nr:hypothetical protein BESB_037600 [Besnoitia besnoiti]PFH37302.1 hypothetical protein BESB_037600 [Besnoitia besnoiti]
MESKTPSIAQPRPLPVKRRKAQSSSDSLGSRPRLTGTACSGSLSSQSSSLPTVTSSSLTVLPLSSWPFVSLSEAASSASAPLPPSVSSLSADAHLSASLPSGVSPRQPPSASYSCRLCYACLRASLRRRLEAAGWLVDSGLKFGVDFILYSRSKDHSHADLGVLLIPYEQATHLAASSLAGASVSSPSSAAASSWFIAGQEASAVLCRVTWRDVVAAARLCLSVSKRLLLAVPFIPATRARTANDAANLSLCKQSEGPAQTRTSSNDTLGEPGESVFLYASSRDSSHISKPPSWLSAACPDSARTAAAPAVSSESRLEPSSASASAGACPSSARAPGGEEQCACRSSAREADRKKRATHETSQLSLEAESETDAGEARREGDTTKAGLQEGIETRQGGVPSHRSTDEENRMSGSKNLIQRRAYRERTQDLRRAQKYPFLEKKKDWNLRAMRHKTQQQLVAHLAEKARTRNEEEFSFRMLKAKQGALLAFGDPQNGTSVALDDGAEDDLDGDHHRKPNGEDSRDEGEESGGQSESCDVSSEEESGDGEDEEAAECRWLSRARSRQLSDDAASLAYEEPHSMDGLSDLSGPAYSEDEAAARRHLTPKQKGAKRVQTWLDDLEQDTQHAKRLAKLAAKLQLKNDLAGKGRRKLVREGSGNVLPVYKWSAERKK